MGENPWTNLPLSAPFVLPNDETLVREWNINRGPSHKYFVHDEFLPEPFVGSKAAPIICLSNQPGVSEQARPI
jgi:hypothetical protein